jgi:hypothetical protein
LSAVDEDREDAVPQQDDTSGEAAERRRWRRWFGL